jgi:micrococcal nuclease
LLYSPDMKRIYEYPATVVRIVDGDTIEARIDVDVGFGLTTSFTQPLRLAGINAPEVHGASKPAGLAAAAWLASQLPLGAVVTTRTDKPREKYGRYLATLYRDGEATSLNEQMVAAGHAVHVTY